jgi:Transposase, Mutator family
VEVSPAVISEVADAVLEEVKAWQNRPFRADLWDRLPGRTVCEDAARRAGGEPGCLCGHRVDLDGRKDVLGALEQQQCRRISRPNGATAIKRLGSFGEITGSALLRCSISKSLSGRKQRFRTNPRNEYGRQPNSIRFMGTFLSAILATSNRTPNWVDVDRLF